MGRAKKEIPVSRREQMIREIAVRIISLREATLFPQEGLDESHLKTEYQEILKQRHEVIQQIEAVVNNYITDLCEHASHQLYVNRVFEQQIPDLRRWLYRTLNDY